MLDRDTEYGNFSNLCSIQSYQKKIIESYYPNIDYNTFIENTTLSYNIYAFKSFCFLLNFVNEHNPQLINKISKPIFENVKSNMMLGNHSLKQLNIIDTGKSYGPFSSVEKMMNKCFTSMGKRKLRDKILHPNTDVNYLKEEYNIIEHLIQNIDSYKQIRKEFANIKDIEKLYRKIVCQKVSPNELYAFHENLKLVIKIHNQISKDNVFKNYIDIRLEDNILQSCQSLLDFLSKNINMDVCSKIYNNKFEENFFNKNVNDVLDETQCEKDNADRILNSFIRYISKFIQISDKKNTSNMIKIHKTAKSGIQLQTTERRSKFLFDNLSQKNHSFPTTLVDNTIKITDFKYSDIKKAKRQSKNSVELKGHIVNELCKDVMSYTESLTVILKNVYKIIIEKLSGYNTEMTNFVNYVSLIDVILTNATVAYKYNYTKPIIKDDAAKSYVSAKDITHPLIENIQTSEIYTPNDIDIGNETDGLLVFGTNGAGKSSYNRSIGIAIIMAQAGLFVPASYFEYKPYTKIFTRILGNDNIFKGMSTFQVEMCELGNILQYADENTLILGDELCSGTENRSAISIFISALEEFKKIKASYIFATHLHQILDKDEFKSIERLDIKHMGVKYNEINDVLVYTRKLEYGPGDSIYGLEVCKSLHLPMRFLEYANKIRTKYDESIGFLNKKKTRYNSHKLKGRCEYCGEEGQDIHHLNPQELAGDNNYIGRLNKNHVANLVNICRKCHLKFTKNNTIHKKVKTINGGHILIEE